MSLVDDVRRLWQMPDEKLKEMASEIVSSIFADEIFIRYIVEVSNICQKNCLYCGLRRENTSVLRYQIPEDEVIKLVEEKVNCDGVVSFVFQSGERGDEEFVRYIGRIVEGVKKIGDISVVLSCGEQRRDVYKYWRDCGADRYLLRIETSNPSLYEKIHPKDLLHSWERRKEALILLKECGYQTGSGVMIGLPWQTEDDLISDIVFLKEIDIDMVGMGPYIPTPGTPLFGEKVLSKEERWRLCCKMASVLRIVMPDINIASTTALDLVHPFGRAEMFDWGANVLMPDITPMHYRQEYLIYDGKPALGCDYCIERYSDRILWREKGDPVHYLKRVNDF